MDSAQDAPYVGRVSVVTRRTALLSAAGGAAAALQVGATAASAEATTTKWSPLQIPGCDLWLDTARHVVDGLDPNTPLAVSDGGVRRMSNLAARRAELVLNQKAPRPGRPSWAPQGCLDFDGREGLTWNLGNGPSSATYIAVIQPVRGRAGAFIGTGLGGRNNGFEFRVNTDGTVTAARSGVWEIGTSTRRVVPDRPNVVAFQYDTNGMWACYVNGQPAGMGRTRFRLDHRSTRTAIGYSAGSSTPAFCGRIAEVVRYRRPLLGHELKRLHRYLAARWNVDLAGVVPPRRQLPGLRGLKGSNIAPKLAHYGSGAVWTSFWLDWDWDWVARSIDVARRNGSNAIRTIGDVAAFADGRLSKSTYLERVQQIVDRCAALGLRYYPCGFSLQERGTASRAAISDLLIAQARLYARHPSTVVGFDLINELATNYKEEGREQTVALALALSRDVKRSVPALPITVSDIGGLDWGALSRATPLPLYRRFATYLDFFDIHVYGPLNDLRAWQLAPYELTVDRPLIIGEFGADGTVHRGKDAAAYYRRVRNLVRATPAVKGVFQWAAMDDRFGLQTETGSRAMRGTEVEWRKFSRP